MSLFLRALRNYLIVSVADKDETTLLAKVAKGDLVDLSILKMWVSFDCVGIGFLKPGVELL
jgi:hypothetical protein